MASATTTTVGGYYFGNLGSGGGGAAALSGNLWFCLSSVFIENERADRTATGVTELVSRSCCLDFGRGK